MTKSPARTNGVGAKTGRELLAAVATMDRLRSPGGCPWDAAQTHTSLLRYLVEECYELVQAIEDGDVPAMREELGDVLLQVLFHARIAAERSGADGFTIDDVAADLVDKLTRRHPDVFAEATGQQANPVRTADDQQSRWDAIKRAEKERDGGRAHVLDGVALAAPAVALAGKLGARAAKFADHTPLPDGDSAAEQIFRIAFDAGVNGEDPESAVRAIARAHAAAMKQHHSE